MDIGVRGDISLLRAVDYTAFDSDYCRKAPPRVQPLVVRECEVEGELLKGKMVLIYDGHYYTTKDATVSNGENYIGMINKFGDYDPSKRYTPLIRTYRKNHLLSRKFKELKAYLLRHSLDANAGYISKEDILLPKSMEYLYHTLLINPSANVVDIHTKKTVITNANKVATGEVPDYVKSLIGTRNVRRYVSVRPGTVLLHCCSIDPEPFADYVCHNLAAVDDTLCIDVDKARSDIISGNVDHRIYGKLLEMYTGLSVLVFTKDGIVPYRSSKLECGSYYVLYFSEGVYDVISATEENGKPLRLDSIRSMVNNLQPVNVPTSYTHRPRDIDYTLTALKLVSYAALTAEELGYNVAYEVVSEDACRALVEDIYHSCIYFEGILSAKDAKYMEELVKQKRSMVYVCKGVGWLQHIYRGMLRVVEDNVIIRSPVNMSSYHKWYLCLEDCLYYSANCYKVSAKEEVQCIYAVPPVYAQPAQSTQSTDASEDNTVAADDNAEEDGDT